MNYYYTIKVNVADVITFAWFTVVTIVAVSII